MEVIKERDMKLLSRKRLYVMVDTESSTPSRSDLLEKVSKKLKVKPEQVVIKHVYPQYGSTKTKLIVHIYDDPSKIEKFEHKNLVKKHQKKEEPKQEKPEETTEKKEAEEEKAQEEKPDVKEESDEEKKEPEKEEGEDK